MGKMHHERAAHRSQRIDHVALAAFWSNHRRQLFVSSDLAKQWAQLDEFEGASYKRRMISVVTNTGTSVANVYLGAQH